MTREEVIQLIDTYKTTEDVDKLRAHFSDMSHCQVNKHTIVFSTPSRTGTSEWRIWAPLLAMYKVTDEFNLVYTEQMHPQHLALADLVVFHRAGDFHDLFHTVIDSWPSHKIKPYVIHNVDDIEFKLPVTHPLYHIWKTANRDKQSLRSIRSSDAVEITTQKMKQTMMSHNRNTVITRNRANWKLPQWNLTKHRPLTEFVPDLKNPEEYAVPEDWNGTDKIIIGWAGLTSHFDDIAKMAPIIKRIHNKYPNTVFILAGMSLGDSNQEIYIDPKTGKPTVKETKIVNEEDRYGSRVKRLFADLDQSRIKTMEALPIEQYGWFNSQFDICLAYVEHNPFNSCKSEIKIVEGIKYGAIPVFSNYAGYADIVESLKAKALLPWDIINKMACQTEFDINEWVDNISFWLDNWNNPVRTETMQTLMDFIVPEYDIDLHIIEQLGRYKNYIGNRVEQYQDKILQQNMAYNPESVFV